MENRNDYSQISEGEQATRNMSGANEPGNTLSGDLLSVLADTHKRLAAVEVSNAQMRTELDAAKNKGEVGFDVAHAQHVLTKYFPHDTPPVEVSEPMVPKFDPFTGQALN